MNNRLMTPKIFSCVDFLTKFLRMAKNIGQREGVPGPIGSYIVKEN